MFESLKKKVKDWWSVEDNRDSATLIGCYAAGTLLIVGSYALGFKDGKRVSGEFIEKISARAFNTGANMIWYLGTQQGYDPKVHGGVDYAEIINPITHEVYGMRVKDAGGSIFDITRFTFHDGKALFDCRKVG